MSDILAKMQISKNSVPFLVAAANRRNFKLVYFGVSVSQNLFWPPFQIPPFNLLHPDVARQWLCKCLWPSVAVDPAVQVCPFVVSLVRDVTEEWRRIMRTFCELQFLWSEKLTSLNMLHLSVVSRSKTSEERLCLHPNVEVVFCYILHARVYSHPNKLCHIPWSSRRSHPKMARTLDKNMQGRSNKTVFPNSHGQNRDKN